MVNDAYTHGVGPKADQEQLELKTKIIELHHFGAVNTAAFLRLLDKLDRVKLTLRDPLVLQRQTVLASNFSQRAGLLDAGSKSRHASTSHMAPFPTITPTAVLDTVAVLRRAISRSLLLLNITSIFEPQSRINDYCSSSITAEKPAQHNISLEDRLIHAAAIGDEDWVRSIIKLGAHPNTYEPITNRTPLCYASINGHSTLVQFLLGAGADPDSRDLFGWTIAEHASYRGHHEVTRFVQAASNKDRRITDTLPVIPSLGKNCSKDSNASNAKVSATTRTSGPTSTSIIVNIGSPYSTSHHAPVEYTSPALLNDVGLLSLEISVSDARCEPYVINLPVIEDLSNKPCVFSIDTALKHTALAVKLFRSHGNSKVLVSSGCALIEVPNRVTTTPVLETIGETKKIPIRTKKQDKLVAIFTYTLLVVKDAPTMARESPRKPFDFGNGIGGHRGQSHFC